MNPHPVPAARTRMYTRMTGAGPTKLVQLAVDHTLTSMLERARRPDETTALVVRRLFRIALAEQLYTYDHAGLPDPWPLLDELAGTQACTRFRKDGMMRGMFVNKLAVTVDDETLLRIWQLKCWGAWYAPTVYRYLLALGLVRCLNDGITDGE